MSYLLQLITAESLSLAPQVQANDRRTVQHTTSKQAKPVSCRDGQLREKEEHKVQEVARQQQLDALQEADRVAALHEYEVRLFRIFPIQLLPSMLGCHSWPAGSGQPTCDSSCSPMAPGLRHQLSIKRRHAISR